MAKKAKPQQSLASESRQPEHLNSVPASAVGSPNKVMAALMIGFLMGGGMVFFFGRYKIIGQDHYEQLVARGGAKITPASPTPPGVTPPGVTPPGAPPAPASPPAGQPPQNAPPPGAPQSTNSLIGPKQKFDYENAAALGKAGAKVTLTVFSDFECPACAQWAPALKQMQSRFGGDLRMIFKHLPLPFHRSARAAAIAAEAAGRQGKFWEMHDLLFRDQNNLKRPKFLEYAKQLNLDVARFTKDLDDPKLKLQVNRDFLEGERAQMPGTPTFYINDRRADIADPNGLHQLIQKTVDGS